MKQSESINKIRTQLKEELSQSQKDLLMQLQDAISDYNALECYEYYSQGFRCGIQLYEELHQKNKNLNENILKELYQEKLDLHNGKDTSKISKLYDQYDSIYQKVYDGLVKGIGEEETKQLLEEFIKIRSQIHYEQNFREFYKGYRLGVQFIIEGIK